MYITPYIPPPPPPPSLPPPRHDRNVPWEERSRKLRGGARKPEPEARTASAPLSVPMLKKPTLPAARKWAREMQMQVCYAGGREGGRGGGTCVCRGRGMWSAQMGEVELLR